jgi:hypothetical protein
MAADPPLSDNEVELTPEEDLKAVVVYLQELLSPWRPVIVEAILRTRLVRLMHKALRHIAIAMEACWLGHKVIRCAEALPELLRAAMHTSKDHDLLIVAGRLVDAREEAIKSARSDILGSTAVERSMSPEDPHRWWWRFAIFAAHRLASAPSAPSASTSRESTVTVESDASDPPLDASVLERKDSDAGDQAESDEVQPPKAVDALPPAVVTQRDGQHPLAAVIRIVPDGTTASRVLELLFHEPFIVEGATLRALGISASDAEEAARTAYAAVKKNYPQTDDYLKFRKRPPPAVFLLREPRQRGPTGPGKSPPKSHPDPTRRPPT